MQRRIRKRGCTLCPRRYFVCNGRASLAEGQDCEYREKGQWRCVTAYCEVKATEEKMREATARWGCTSLNSLRCAHHHLDGNDMGSVAPLGP